MKQIRKPAIIHWLFFGVACNRNEGKQNRDCKYRFNGDTTTATDNTPQNQDYAANCPRLTQVRKILGHTGADIRYKRGLMAITAHTIMLVCSDEARRVTAKRFKKLLI